MEEGYRLFLSSLALLVDPILLAFLDYPPDGRSLSDCKLLSRLCPRRSPKEKKATHIFAPPHNSLVLCSLLVKSLPLRARQNRRELNGRKKARKRNYQHNPDSWLKTDLFDHHYSGISTNSITIISYRLPPQQEQQEQQQQQQQQQQQ
ncbi:hypothetical protein V6Z79_007898 [Aspergillus fumigatus]